MPDDPFVEPGTDPVEDYVKRYATEPDYAAWFDENYADQYASICEAVGLEGGCVEEYNAAAAAADLAAQEQAPAATGPADFVDPAADPYEEYVKRYVGDAEFRAWFDESYPGRQFCDAVGLEAGCVGVYEARAAAAEAADRQLAEAEEAAKAEAAEAEAAAVAEAEAAALQAALEESCGDGTVLRDGACVALPPPRDPVGSGRELATGVVAAFVIALAAGVIFWLVSRAGRRKRRRTADGGDGSDSGDAAPGGNGGGPDPYSFDAGGVADDTGAGAAGRDGGNVAGASGSGGYGMRDDDDGDEPRGRGTIV